VLGPDPVSPKEGVADKVSRRMRGKYQRMRRQAPPPKTAASSGSPGPGR